MSINKKDLKEFILKQGKEATEANKSRAKNIDEWQKRFEALRSTASLDDDIKKKPWYGAANVGIPIDATVVYTIVARLVRATWGVTPEIGVRPSDLKHSNPLQAYINWQLWDEMRMFMPLMMIYQGMMVDGDKIVKTSIEKDEVYFDDDVIMFVDAEGNPYISKETGSEVEAEHEDQPSIYDENLIEYKPRKVESTKSRVTYYGPKATNIPIKHVIVPQDADTTDCSEVDWIIHEFWKPYGWIHTKAEQSPEIFDKDAVAVLKKNKDKTRAMEEDPKMKVLGLDLKTKTKMFKFWEWHGKFEDDDGNTHELIALLCPDEKEFLGFVPNRFYFKRGRRQFVHYTAFPQDGKFWGKGVPEWLRGIRSMLDALINTGLDRNAIFDNAPILFDIKNSGFDPDTHKFGPGKTWGLRKITPEAIRRLEMPMTGENSLQREEMLFDIVQKLFGVNDYALGSSRGKGTTAANKTAMGVSSIVNEGNLRFDVMIRLVQQYSNPELANQVFGHFIMNRYSIMQQKGLKKPRSIFDPIMQMSEDELNADFDYVFKGNTSTVNPQIEQQQAVQLYELFTKTQNPFVVSDPDVVHDMTEQILNSFEVKGLKIKTKEEYRKMHATEGKGAQQQIQEAIQKQGQGQQQEQPQGAA